MKPRRKHEDRPELERHFEGRARLAALLARAGSLVEPEQVAAGFEQAQAQKLSPADVFPALFEAEPRFDSSDDARALYANLLGLWDLVEEGKTPDLAAPAPREKKVKAPAAEPPAPVEGAPDAAFVEAAWRYLEACAPKELTRLTHAFENRQDALLVWLDLEAAQPVKLTDDAFGVAREICFELFAVLHLARRGGWPGLRPGALEKGALPVAPAPLATWADELLFDAEHDEDRALAPEQMQRVRALVGIALRALWHAGT